MRFFLMVYAMKTLLLGIVLICSLAQFRQVFAVEFPPVFEKIHPYLATPAPGHLNEIPVVIMRFLPTKDGVNLDVSKAPDFYDLGEITLDELKSRIDRYDKRVKFMLEEGTRFRGYKNPDAVHSIGYRVVEYITVYKQTPQGPVNQRLKDGKSIYFPDYHRIFGGC